jgi:hypothetical protein
MGTAGDQSWIKTYEYFTDHGCSTGNNNQGISFLGRQNANPIMKVQTSPAPIIGPAQVQYLYEYDSGNRITKMTASNNVVELFAYY